MLSIFSGLGKTGRISLINEFRYIVYLQISIIAVSVIFTELLQFLGLSGMRPWIESLFILQGGVYLLMLRSLLLRFTGNRYVNKISLILLLFAYVATVIFANPFFRFLEDFPQRVALFVIHSTLFVVEFTVIIFSIRDFLRTNYPIAQKLWGSACVYLMIGISFGSCYDLICISMPGALGYDIDPGLPGYFECIYHSMNVLGGLDDAFPDALQLVKSIGIIEALWSNLFVVLLVGRLVSNPETVGNLFKTTHLSVPLVDIEIYKKRYKAYNGMLITMVVLIILGLTSVEFVYHCQIDSVKVTAVMLFFVLGGFYVYGLLRLLDHLNVPGWIKITSKTLLVVAFATGFILTNPVYPLGNHLALTPVLLMIHLALLLAELVVIAYATHDIFGGSELTFGKLTGTACLYLMIGMVFAGVYELFCILDPELLGMYFKPGLRSYSQSVSLSMNTLAGLDTLYPDAKVLIKKAMVLEAVAGELFMAIMVGNLLSRPEKEK